MNCVELYSISGAWPALHRRTHAAPNTAENAMFNRWNVVTITAKTHQLSCRRKTADASCHMKISQINYTMMVVGCVSLCEREWRCSTMPMLTVYKHKLHGFSHVSEIMSVTDRQTDRWHCKWRACYWWRHRVSEQTNKKTILYVNYHKTAQFVAQTLLQVSSVWAATLYQPISVCYLCLSTASENI